MKSQIVIFSILDSPALGGAEEYLISNLEFLSKQGFEITLATHNQEIKNNYHQKFNIINLPYHLDLIGNIRGAIKFFIQTPLAIIWLIGVLSDLKKNYQQVIVYTPGFTERLIFSPFIKLLGLKLIWIEFGPVKAVFRKNLGLPKILYRLCSSFPDQVITISKYSQRSLRTHTSIPNHKISIIHPGTPKITQTKLKSLQKKGVAWRTKHNLKSKKLITFVGRLATEKEVSLLIKAFAKLKIKNARLIIIGTGPEEKIYQKLAKDLKITNKIIFVGYVSSLMKTTILASSNIFVFPSSWEMEGFGMTTIEAMMTATPVITSGSGPQKEIVMDRRTGLFFKPHHVISLSSKIEELLKDQNLAKKLGLAGRKKALASFTRALMHQQTFQLVRSRK
jgi:glycosyltransferase involved in cell wall biosynthesis